MESSEAVNTEVAQALSRPGAWLRSLLDRLSPLIGRVKRRPLFQKVIICNTVLIASGSMAIYLEKISFAGGKLYVQAPFIVSGALLIIINFALIKLAFRPLDDVTDTMKAIGAGHHEMQVPMVKDDPQIEELSRSMQMVLATVERQRRLSAAAAIEAQEKERKRIARDLHDETSQSLTGLMIGIRMVEDLVPDSMPEIQDRLHHIKDLAQSTLKEVHMMATRLRPSVLDDLGLPAALRSYVLEFSENTGIRVDLTMPANSERLHPELEMVLYRVIQEALTNVARHSGADLCHVALDKRGRKLHCMISDNGCGFDPETVFRSSRGSGLGLNGMKERIKLVEGSLTFDSRRNEGSIILVEVPIDFKEGFR